MSFLEVILVLAGIILFTLVQSFIDIKKFNHRGHAQPDNPEEDNYPIITEPKDAQAWKVIDEAKQNNKEK